MKLSKKISQIEASDLAKVSRMAKEYEARGIKVIHLERGEPDFDMPRFIAESIYRAMLDGKTHYPPLQGEKTLLEALAEKVRKKNGIEAGVENIAIVLGGMHGLYVALRTILDPGDEVLVFTPYWLSISKLIGLADGSCSFMPFYIPLMEGWLSETDFEKQLDETITPRTRVIYVNTPNNPSGAVVPRSYLEALARKAVERDLIVLSDEAYEDIVFDNHRHFSISSIPGMLDRTVTCFAFSKSYAMTGLRLGYLVGPKDFIQLAWSRMILYTTNGIPAPIQVGAVAALRQGDKDIERMRRAYEERRDIFVQELRKVKGLRTLMPQGAFYVFADVSALLNGGSIYDLIRDWLEVGVAVAPGMAFGAEYAGWVRFSTASSMEELVTAARALQKRYGTNI